jgi:hypothetical protein
VGSQTKNCNLCSTIMSFSEKTVMTLNVKSVVEIIDKYSVYLAQDLQDRCFLKYFFFHNNYINCQTVLRTHLTGQRS